MVTYLCEVIDTQGSDNANERIVVASSKCLTLECAKSFIESSMLRLVPSFIAIRADWTFWEGRVLIAVEGDRGTVYGKIKNIAG